MFVGLVGKPPTNPKPAFPRQPQTTMSGKGSSAPQGASGKSGQYKDKTKPAMIRTSNIQAAKGACVAGWIAREAALFAHQS